MTYAIIECTPELAEHYASTFTETIRNLKSGYTYTPSTLAQLIADMNAQGTKVFCALSEEEGIIGVCSVVIEISYLRGGSKAAHLEGLSVRSGFTGLGIGSALIRQAIEYAKEIQCYKIMLSSSEMLVPYYEKFGFENMEVCMKQYLTIA